VNNELQVSWIDDDYMIFKLIYGNETYYLAAPLGTSIAQVAEQAEQYTDELTEISIFSVMGLLAHNDPDPRHD
jgi:hypothetical protein